MFASRPIRLTRFGVFYLLFCIGVGAAAINTGNNLLYLILGFQLGLIVVSGVLSDSSLWGLDAEWHAVGDFYAGREAVFDLTLQKQWFPAVLLHMDAQWNQAPINRFLFFWVPHRDVKTVRVAVPLKKRGILRLDRVRYASFFPFGLFEKFHSFPGHQEWVVYPAIRSIPLERLRAPGSSLSQTSIPQKGWGTIPFDLRDFQWGDSLKRIHWKTSLKRQRLTVKEMEAEGDLSSLLYISRWPEESAVEDFISFVASLLVALYAKGLKVGLQTPGVLLTPDHSTRTLRRLLTYLATVEPQKELRRRSASDVANHRWIDAVTLWRNDRAIAA